MKMKAPAKCSSAVIEGHDYSKELQKSKDGTIQVAQDGHIETLKRHGFTEIIEEPGDLSEKIDSLDDKDELVEFIEERGGEADNSMGMKKLRRLARAAAGLEE
jgi:hypothetical protein